jgi:type IV fimbrial biogenesis protein FimT
MTMDQSMRSPKRYIAMVAVARRGFTLIELLVTMALLAIMLALAAPSFVTFQRNSELTATANSFVAALSAARAEAMKRQLRTFVIPASGATNWASGWTVFVDVDGNVTSGAMLASSADVVVSRQPALPDSVSVNTSTIATPFVDSGVAYAMFNGSGFMTTLAGGFVTNGLELTNGTESRRIIANTTGRLRVCKPADADCNTGGGF